MFATQYMAIAVIRMASVETTAVQAGKSPPLSTSNRELYLMLRESTASPSSVNATGKDHCGPMFEQLSYLQ